MKNLFTTLGVLAILAIPVQSFAWTYDGLGSLNPLTAFGTRTNNTCGCKKPKLTKCEKLHGVKIKKVQGTPCGCAAPIEKEYVKIVPQNYNHNTQPCTDCQRAF